MMIIEPDMLEAILAAYGFNKNLVKAEPLVPA